MATTIGQLHVVLGANIKKFSSGFQRAIAPVQNFASRVGTVAKTVAKYGAIAAAAAVAIGGAMVRSQMQAIDALAKTSDKLDIATEQLAGLHHAAELSGVSTKSLDTSLQRMTRRVSEAAIGTGEAQGALRELGLSATEMSNLSPDEQFRRITEAMGGVAKQGDKVRIATKLFDTEGVALVNTMAKGTAGLDAAQAAAERFGLAVSRTDAAAVEAANDAITSLKGSFTGIFRQLTVQLAPAIQQIAVVIQNLVAKGKSLMGGMFDKIMGWIQPLIDRFGDIKMMLIRYWVAVKGYTLAVWDTIMGAIDGVLSWFGSEGESAIGGFADMFIWLGEQITNIMHGAEYGIRNFGQIWDLTVATVKLKGVQFVGWLQHALGTVLPGYLKWFGENWKEIFADAFNFTLTVIKNLSGNIVRIVQNIPKLISGQVSFSELWTPLTEGFESSIKELPDIPKREMGEVEKSLSAEVDKLSNEVSKGFAEFQKEKEREAQQLANSLNELGDSGDDAADGLNKAADGAKAAGDAIQKNGEKITQKLAELQQQIDEFGMSDADKELSKLADLGASDKQLQQAGKLLARYDKLQAAEEERNSMMQEAQSVIDSLMTPMQEYEREIAKLDDLVMAGMLSWDQYDKAVAKARETLNDAAGDKSNPLLRAGTAGARKFLFETQDTGIGKMQDAQQQQVKEQRQTNEILEGGFDRLNNQMEWKVVDIA